MSDADFVPLENLESARDLPLEEQAECLLRVLYPVIETMHDPPDAPVEAAVTGTDARQVFRQCSESLCRPLSKNETRELLELTLFRLCERLTYVGADTDNETTEQP